MAKEVTRANEPVDYVAQMRNMNEASRKNEFVRLKWQKDYQWLCDEYKIVEEEMRELCDYKNTTDEDGDSARSDGSLRPIPLTTNGLYGWLAKNNNFNLEKYGSYIVNYPNPLNDIISLSGNIPNLATGNPFV